MPDPAEISTRQIGYPGTEPDVGGFGAALADHLRRSVALFWRPAQLARSYRLTDLRPDLIAGLTVAVVALPQAIAYALIAELPPQVGLYTAIVGAIVGALWGSSNQLTTGPSNASSLLVLSVLLGVAIPGTTDYLVAAGLLALMVGLFRLALGMARLGRLVNFVSDSVVVGFSAAAGLLICANQVRHLLRLPIPSASQLWDTLPAIAASIGELHWPSLLIGLGTLATVLALRWANRAVVRLRSPLQLPGPLLAMVGASVVVALLRLDTHGVRVAGELPRGLPPLADLSRFDLALAGKLVTGALTIGAIGLVESISTARAIAAHTHQRLDSNQEFVGQGLANIACGLFSGYMCSGSPTRSYVNHEAGARTPLASVFTGLFVLGALLGFGSLATAIPLAALAGVLIVTAFSLVNRTEIVRIWRSSPGDRLIMLATFAATLLLPLEYGVLTGIILSVGHYLLRTSTPRVQTVFMNEDFRYFAPFRGRLACPELGVIEIRGDLYFGAVNHVEESIERNLLNNPTQRFLLLRMYTVERCDISGIHALESITREYRERKGDVFFVHVQPPVLELMQASGFYGYAGADHFLDPDAAIGYLFHNVIDPAICIYECPVRAFLECQNLPKRLEASGVRWDAPPAVPDVPSVAAPALWSELHGAYPPQVIDVREPREFRSSHIPGAHPLPLPALLQQIDLVPNDRPVVLVCRGGRRSTRATALLRERGYKNVRVLAGGMQAWERHNLLEAIE